MEKILLSIIKQLLSRIVTKDVFNMVAERVWHYATSNLSGTEKKEAVITDVKAAGKSIKSSLLNFTIEYLVLRLKTK